MTTFWILVGALALLCTLLIARTLTRAADEGDSPAAYDLRVYRDQLREVDRDLARGVLSEAEAERVRNEVSRRILAADAALQADGTGTGQPAMATGALAGALIVVLIGGSLLVYLSYGAPGYGDLALADRIAMAEERRTSRPSQQEAEESLPAGALPRPEAVDPDYVALVTRLREVVAERPDDVQGQRFLAQAERNLGNYSEAHAIQARLIETLGASAGTDEWVNYADMLILSAGGYVSPEAEAALARVLRDNPRSGIARYYWGLMQAQIDRPDLAFNIWDRLLREGPADAPWIPPIQAQIEEIAGRAGVRYTPPPIGAGIPGPSQDDIDATADMSPAQRLEMIEGMVSGLAQRLGSEGGPPEEWAQLITSLGVLGRQDDARRVYLNALEAFDGNPGALDTLARAAEQANVGP